MIGGRVLDATAISDIAIGRSIYAAAFLAAANDLGIALALPAAALHEAWARAGEADYPFVDLLLALPLTLVDPLDGDAAARSGTAAGPRPGADPPTWNPSAAHAALVSRERGWPVLTADPASLQAIDPELALDLLPGE
ncbi:MAG: hypothetical protein WAL50_13275 [Kineosporiaceae bacterium]